MTPEEREIALEELRAKIQHGSEQADRGELLDGDAVFRQIAIESRTVKVFADAAVAASWLNTSNSLLGGQTPAAPTPT